MIVRRTRAGSRAPAPAPARARSSVRPDCRALLTRQRRFSYRQNPMPSQVTAEAEEVLAVLGACEDAVIGVWLDGGWGVDALLGSHTRPHRDIDIVVPLRDIDRLLLALHPLGYAMAEDHLPTQAVLRSIDGREVDVHPVALDDHGDGWQAQASPDGSDCRYPANGFVTGTIAGHVVPCLSTEVQVAHHMGYRPRPHDREDMHRLAAAFGIELEHPYRAESSRAPAMVDPPSPA